MSSESDRPLPLPDEATRGFWEACRRHELVMQRCVGCARARFPPRPMCPDCQSMESEWVPVSGRGRIYSFVIAHPPVLPAFQGSVPLPIVLVELEEDPSLRVIGNVVEDRGGLGARGGLEDRAPRDGEGAASSIEGLAIGAPVEVVFEDVAEDVSLPQWRIVD